MTGELMVVPHYEPDKIDRRRAKRCAGPPDLHRVTAEEIERSCAVRQHPRIPAITWRNRDDHVLLVRFLWVTGCRITEALGVTTQDFDFGARCVRLRTLKRRREHFRALPLPNAFCGELAQWIAYARPGPGDQVFPWRRSQGTAIVTKVLLSGGVDRRRAHPHAIRHGHAFHALAHRVPVNALQAALGHAHLSTTAIYTQATAADLRASYDRVPW
jgi:integrase